MKGRRIFSCFFAICSSLLSPKGNAQVTYDLSSNGTVLNFRPQWKYHEGDNPAWAAASFDDKGWQTVNIKKWNQYTGDFRGICWFRQTFRVPPKLFHKTLLLLVKQSGASQIYLNNKLVNSFGTVGDLKTELPYDPENDINYIQLDGDSIQVIAVRFSSYKVLKKGFAYCSIDLNLAGLDSTNQLFGLNRAGIDFSLVLYGVLLTISIFHLLLFLYYHKVRSNLYYSILAFLLSFLMLYPYLIRSSHNPMFGAFINEVDSFLYAPCFFLIVVLLYSIFNSRLNWFFWVMLGLTIFTDISIPVGFNWYMFLAITQGVTACIGSIIYVIRAVRRKKAGAIIIASGFIVFLAVILIVFLGFAIGRPITFDETSSIVEIIYLIWILSVPVSMSVYLASDFARINKKLELELLHVKQLGEQNVQKEIEKQEIIKGQKQELERKIREATAEILHQKDELAEKNRDITDSISYARRIQTAILPDESLLEEALGDYLVLFKPKDVVSGDFYWCHKVNDKIIFVVADCTGHGVPGAFMSMIGISLLNEIILGKGITEANSILDELRSKLTETLQQNAVHPSSRDGMDIALCVWNKNDNVLQFAGANNRLYLISKDIAINGSVLESERVKLSNNHLLEILPDKQPIGYQEDKMNNPFTKSIIQLNKGDTIFISSDGFTDQFGGENNKKFTSKKFKALLASLTGESIQKQKSILEQVLNDWKKAEIQTDDICILGVRI